MGDEEKIEEDLEDAGSDWLSQVEEEPEGPEEPIEAPSPGPTPLSAVPAQAGDSRGGELEEEGDEHWMVGTWGTLDQWRCNYCQFDALSEDAMVAHYEAVHKPPPPRRDPKIVVADRFGNEVK